MWHQESEPSRVPGMGVFHNLGVGYEVPGVVRCVDDLTLQRDLDKHAAPEPGWFRVVSDDVRLLALVKRHCDPAAASRDVLGPVAELFGCEVQGAGGMWKVMAEKSPVAMAVPLPGERHRACELITPPMGADRAQRLTHLLTTATRLGFVPATEGATHIHLDGAALRDAARLQTFARRWLEVADDFPRNPHHRRVGPWSEETRLVLFADDFRSLPWPEAAARLRGVATKYCDLNLRGLAAGGPTVELRVLPALLDADAVVGFVERFVELTQGEYS